MATSTSGGRIVFYLFTFFIAYKKIIYKVVIRFCGVEKSQLIEFDGSSIEDGVLGEVEQTVSFVVVCISISDKDQFSSTLL